MIIGVPKDNYPDENRIALVPASVERLVKKDVEVFVEQGLGDGIGLPDEAFTKAGAKTEQRDKIFACADMIMRLRKPSEDEIQRLKKGCIYISFLDPFNESALLETFLKYNISAISMEMIPRTTIAQKMDALSSQANLGGYVAVIIAAERSNKIFPMMMTPSGTIPPAHVFVIGAGVAGLQAIATAKRLGARVEAFDTRAVVEEQVRSLGAKFIKIDLGETGQTKDGYAKALTEEQIKKQQEGMAKVCANSDIVITTAQLFGRKAPRIITKDMVSRMKPGSVIVDMAVESGGNVEGSQLGQEVDVNGITIIGLANLPGRVALPASQMYAKNLTNFFETYYQSEEKRFPIDPEDNLLKGCLITHEGQIVNETIKKHHADAQPNTE